MTPLHWAVEREHAAVVDTLVQNDADVTCLNKVSGYGVVWHTGKVLACGAVGPQYIL